MKETLSAPTSLFSSILTSMGQQAEQSLQTVCFVIILLLTLDYYLIALMKRLRINSK